MRSVYIDNNAPRLSSRSFEAMTPFLSGGIGQCLIHHQYGQRARSAVEKARSSAIAALLNRPNGGDCLHQGGTEGDNAAILE